MAALYTYSRALQLRFHLWLQLIQSRHASRWCYTLLGIFSLDELTFERLLRVSAPVSNCLRVLGSSLQGRREEEREGKERGSRKGIKMRD